MDEQEQAALNNVNKTQYKPNSGTSGSGKKSKRKKKRTTITSKAIDDSERTWKEYFRDLEAFQKEHGHVNVTQDNCDDEDLLHWISLQRENADKLTRRQRKLLFDINFDFEFRSDKLDRLWEEKFQALKEFKVRVSLCVACSNVH